MRRGMLNGWNQGKNECREGGVFVNNLSTCRACTSQLQFPTSTSDSSTYTCGQ